MLIVVIALSSIGYITSSLNQNPDPEWTGSAELDPEELAKRKFLQDFILTEENGDQKKLSDYRGNVVILSFWAKWCAPCLVELPTFAQLEEKFRGRGLRIVPINVDEGDDGKSFSKEYWATHDFKFPRFFDTHKALAQQFDVEMLPSNFVIDRQGRLVFSSFGANDWSSQQTIEFIEGLLQEPEEAQPL